MARGGAWRTAMEAVRARANRSCMRAGLRSMLRATRPDMADGGARIAMADRSCMRSSTGRANRDRIPSGRPDLGFRVYGEDLGLRGRVKGF